MSTSAMMRRLATENTLPPDVDGMGYKTDHIQGGAGFSYTRYASKVMPNGIPVSLVESIPSPYDVTKKGITSRYLVYLGMSDQGEDLKCPFECPSLATSWAPDGEVNWHADFGEDGAAAESFASSAPVPEEGMIARRISVSERKLPLYFRPESQGGLLEKARETLAAQNAEQIVERPCER